MATSEERIGGDPGICSGKAVVKGTRIMVRNILERLRDGDGFEEILKSYPSIERADIEACLTFAIEAVDERRPLQLR